MLNLNATPQVKIEHEETGTSYLIRPILPRDNQKLMKQARDKKGDLDYVSFNGLLVAFAVIEWWGVGGPDGSLPPSDENKKALGEKFPVISNFVNAKATDIKLFVDEVKAAKND